MRFPLRVASGVALASTLVGCGRTEPYWWSDIYASDTGDDVGTSGSDTGDESSSGDSTDTSSSTDSESDSNSSDTMESSSTDSSSTDSGSTDGCPPTPIDLSVDPPTVVFLLEQASHMNQDFVPGVTLWEAAGTALFDPMQGIAPAWEDELRLGLTSFTSFNGSQGGACPILVESAPALVNASDMETTWLGAQPADENPVGDAVTTLSASMAIDPSPGSKTIVLLSARSPDTCAQPNPQNGANAAVAAVDAAFQAGVGTRLIALGALANPYAQGLANVGVGLPAQGMTMAAWSSPADLSELVADLDAVLTSLRPCSFTLVDAIALGGEASCTATLAGQPLPLDNPDGWSVDAGVTLILQGQACTDFQQLGTLPELLCECDALP